MMGRDARQRLWGFARYAVPEIDQPSGQHIEGVLPECLASGDELVENMRALPEDYGAHVESSPTSAQFPAASCS